LPSDPVEAPRDEDALKQLKMSTFLVSIVG